MSISVGVICFKLDNEIYNTFINNLKNVSYYNLDNIIMNNIHKYEYYNKYIKFLLVKRRHSLNYIDFIRGNYNINFEIDIDIDHNHDHDQNQDPDQLYKMFSLMSCNEIELIKTSDFNKLWEDLWLKNAYKKKYLDEMYKSKKKFNYLKNNGFLNNISSNYVSTEWEIPKGRKNTNETNLDCAIREFKEETLLDKSNYDLINIIDPIHDTFIGTNGKKYTHIFYHSLFNNKQPSSTLINVNFNSNNEIEYASWLSWSELYDYIRPYNKNKINILTTIFLFIINVLCDIQNEPISF
jgi:8-oxo-dGTP pyrophosphatase MutT (NUDIX family)